MDLCNINEIKALLARHGFHFSKAKGQNFLTQSWVPQNIVLESGVDETCGVLEVGPGIGPLTQQLCRYAKKVVAVEVDRTLQPVLAALLESRAFEAVTVMVQKEVAQRICSPAGKGDYGAFSVFCQYYAEPELLFDVPASCFIPQPKVTSAVLKLTMRKESVCEIKSEAMFFKVVRAAFAQRRKTLLNALSSGLSQFDKPALAAVIEDCGFAPTVRGETLDIPGFAAIANALTEL